MYIIAKELQKALINYSCLLILMNGDNFTKFFLLYPR